MEKKNIRISPYCLKGGPHKGLTFKAYVSYDENTVRNVTISGPWNNWPKQIWDQYKMKSVFINYMFRSNIPYNLTRQQFLTMTFNEFNEVTITNELLKNEQNE